MQLYTVELENKHIVSTFDSKGRKTGEKMDLIKQTIRDLPYSTAMMYKTKDAGRVTIIPQDMSDFGDKRRSGFVDRKAQSRPVSTITTKKAPAARPKQSSVQAAAAAGDMTAAINAKE